MGKSFRQKGFFDDYDYEYEDQFDGGRQAYKKPKKHQNDKKLEIQKARKKAQAERDKAVAEYSEIFED